jgi:hypothetical protein
MRQRGLGSAWVFLFLRDFVAGQWTLGFEATGPADLLRSELQATATLVFAQALPGGAQPGPDESSSYAQWLSLRPGAGGDADA